MSDDTKLWERQPYDTDTSFDRFQRYYLNQDPPRSVNEAYRLWYAERCNLSVSEVSNKRASGAWQQWAWPAEGQSWPERAKAFDDHLAQLRQAEWERQHMPKAEVLARLAAMARGDIGEFANALSPAQLVDHPKSGLVHKIKTRAIRDKDGKVRATTQLELYNAQSALQLIGKHHKLFTDRQEVDVSGNMEIKVIYGDRNKRTDSSST